MPNKMKRKKAVRGGGAAQRPEPDPASTATPVATVAPKPREPSLLDAVLVAAAAELPPMAAAAVGERYEPRDDAVDPYHMLCEEIIARISREFASCVDGSRDAVLRRWWTEIAGPPRPESAPRVQLQFTGEPGVRVPADWVIESADGLWFAQQSVTTDGGGVVLTRIVAVHGRTKHETADLTSVLQGDDRLPVAGQSLHAVDITLADGPTHTFPGLVWELSAPLAARVSAVTVVDGPELRWQLDRRGRLIVPVQELGDPGPPAESLVVRVDVTIEPEEVAALGALRVNVIECEVRPRQAHLEDTVPDAAVFEAERPGLIIAQPWSASPAVPAESDTEWQCRVATEVRHRRRAVIESDYLDMMAARFPDVRVLAFEPTGVNDRGVLRPAVRLVLGPTVPEALELAVDRTIAAGREAERFFVDRVSPEVRVVAGPPSLHVDCQLVRRPASYPYRDIYHAGGAALLSSDGRKVRRDGSRWPVYTLEEFLS